MTRPDLDDHYELARILILDVVDSWLIDESDWFYESQYEYHEESEGNLEEQGFDLDTLRTIIKDMVQHIP